MSTPTNIADLAEQLIAQATASTKIAAAPAEPSRHPVVTELRKVAALIRATPDDEPVSLEAVQKFAMAMQPGTGAQSPSAGGSVGANPPAPSIPSLKTSNLGVTAGTGGAPATMKISSELRKIASDIRSNDPAVENATKIAHTLNAARGLQYLREGLPA